jgi:hypothetical protein
MDAPERAAIGRAARSEARRSSHAAFAALVAAIESGRIEAEEL